MLGDGLIYPMESRWGGLFEAGRDAGADQSSNGEVGATGGKK